MGKKTSVELAVQAAQSVVHQPVFIINNAPVLHDVGPESEEQHRGNTGWIIAIPALQIAVPAVDRKGNPQVGFFDDTVATAQAEAIWRQCKEDPEALAAYQDEYAWPEDFLDGHKIMQRFISVPAL